MRKRNIKINVFLNENEKKMLEEKSNEARLSQSDFIRKIIDDDNENKIHTTNNNNLICTLLNSISAL